jgi:hypothetical protein
LVKILLKKNKFKCLKEAEAKLKKIKNISLESSEDTNEEEEEDEEDEEDEEHENSATGGRRRVFGLF